MPPSPELTVLFLLQKPLACVPAQVLHEHSWWQAAALLAMLPPPLQMPTHLQPPKHTGTPSPPLQISPGHDCRQFSYSAAYCDK